MKAAIAQLDNVLKPVPPDATTDVWQGSSGRNYATISAEDLRKLRRRASGAVVPQELAHLVKVIENAPPDIDVRFWLGSSIGASPSINMRQLRLLAGVV